MPAKPNTIACQTPPKFATCRPPAVVPVQVLQVEDARHPEQPQGVVRSVRPGEQARVDGRGQGAAVCAPGFVELEVRRQRPVCRLLRHEVVQHQDVGLLDHLGRADAFAAEQEIRCDRGLRVLGDDQRCEGVVAGELLVAAGGGVVPVHELVRDPAPCRDLGRRDAALGLGEFRRPAEVPPRHHVREGVVVDEFVVLVRSDDVVDVAATVLDANTRRPVPGRVQDQGAALASEEGAVPRPQGVLERRPGDVGDHVLLVLAGVDRHYRSVRVHVFGGGHVETTAGRLPGEPRAAQYLGRRRGGARRRAVGFGIRAWPVPRTGTWRP